MTPPDDSSPSIPPGWYQYGTSNEQRWWDGETWLEPATDEQRAEEAARRGAQLLEIPGYHSNGSLRVYENEVWKIMPAGVPGTMGGNLGGARAEVVMQSAMDVGGRYVTAVAATMIRVVAPTFEFSFAMSLTNARENALRLAQFNWAADYINNRSRDLAPAAETAPSAGHHSVADEIAKFAALRDQGILTDEEFTAKKAQLLA